MLTTQRDSRMFLLILRSAISAFGVYGLYRLLKFFHGELATPFRGVPGPKNSSWIYGNFKELLHMTENPELADQWIKTYGTTTKCRGLFGVPRLCTVDLKAVNHIIKKTDIYCKPYVTRHTLGRILGEGVLVVEGEQHRRQSHGFYTFLLRIFRKVLNFVPQNPAFGPVQVRDLMDTFLSKSMQLRDIWISEATLQGGCARLDALVWLSRATLDVIGLAGFNYKFDALGGEPDDLNRAFTTLFESATNFEFFPLLQTFFPPLRLFTTSRDRVIASARAVMARIGHQLLVSSKEAAIQADSGDACDGLRSRNLLSLLVKANISEGIPDHQRLSDDDVLAQVPTFITAGHETTRQVNLVVNAYMTDESTVRVNSNSTTWALFSLTQNIAAQNKLREELLSIPTDMPSMDELNNLPYLDAVIRETLRLHSPVPTTLRVATTDDVLPLSEPFTDETGAVHHSVHFKKGQMVTIPIVVINTMKAIWGENAAEFIPERWESIPEAATAIPGIWGNSLTFLGGPRACIGWRFAVIEMKALLFTLIRSFSFELAVPPEQMTKVLGIVQRPLWKSEQESANIMPLIIRPYQ